MLVGCHFTLQSCLCWEPDDVCVLGEKYRGGGGHFNFGFYAEYGVYTVYTSDQQDAISRRWG